MELEKIFKRLQKAGKVLADFSAAAHNELKLGRKNCNSEQSLVDNAPNYTQLGALSKRDCIGQPNYTFFRVFSSYCDAQKWKKNVSLKGMRVECQQTIFYAKIFIFKKTGTKS